MSNLSELLVSLPKSVGFGVGLDMPWGMAPGFIRTAEGDTIDPSLRAFFHRYQDDFQHVFFAFQPKDRSFLDIEYYKNAYSAFFAACERIPNRSLHHTMLNVAGGTQYDRDELIEFTNAIIDLFSIKWINEDIGIWSLFGKALPYPLPPILSSTSLDSAVAVVDMLKTKLNAPFILEFPGFTDGSAVIFGDMHAFDYFRELAEQTDSLVNLDTGHIISYQFLTGRPDKLMVDIERLPLDRCFEIHLAGSELVQGRFRDMHHGELLPQQFDLLSEFLKRCKTLRAVTYEDPKFDANGALLHNTVESYNVLRGIMTRFGNSKNA
jgi:uncharacterized protein